MLSAITVAGRPAPKTATAMTASRMPGKASEASRTPARAASVQPRRHAPTIASVDPATVAKTTMARGPRKLVRAPYRSRESRSAALMVVAQRMRGIGSPVGAFQVDEIGVVRGEVAARRRPGRRRSRRIRERCARSGRVRRSAATDVERRGTSMAPAAACSVLMRGSMPGELSDRAGVEQVDHEIRDARRRSPAAARPPARQGSRVLAPRR